MEGSDFIINVSLLWGDSDTLQMPDWRAERDIKAVVFYLSLAPQEKHKHLWWAVKFQGLIHNKCFTLRSLLTTMEQMCVAPCRPTPRILHRILGPFWGPFYGREMLPKLSVPFHTILFVSCLLFPFYLLQCFVASSISGSS